MAVSKATIAKQEAARKILSEIVQQAATTYPLAPTEPATTQPPLAATNNEIVQPDSIPSMASKIREHLVKDPYQQQAPLAKLLGCHPSQVSGMKKTILGELNHDLANPFGNEPVLKKPKKGLGKRIETSVNIGQKSSNTKQRIAIAQQYIDSEGTIDKAIDTLELMRAIRGQ